MLLIIDFLLVSGGIVPSYGIVFGLSCPMFHIYIFPVAYVHYVAKGVTGFSDINSHQRRHDGDRNALWYAELLNESIMADEACYSFLLGFFSSPLVR